MIHLGDRECSIQRRHQKVIEEAPSPFLDDEQREQLGAQAVSLARSVGYTSAGTVEMIADDEGGFFFLEMNTRLQVEHPVTEMITGIDIVAEQVRVAAGEPLSITQADVPSEGPRDRGADLRRGSPARLPASDRHNRAGALAPMGPGVRVDHGLREGNPVTASFDPMLAKIVAHGPDRAAALQRAIDALGETVLLGVTTNTGYLRRVLEHPAFAAADLHTGFLTEHADELVDDGPTAEQLPVLVAAALLCGHDPRHDPPAALDAIGAWRPVMEHRYTVDDGEPEVVTLVRGLHSSTLRSSGGEHDVALRAIGGGRSEVTVDGRVVPVWLAKTRGHRVPPRLRSGLGDRRR